MNSNTHHACGFNGPGIFTPDACWYTRSNWIIMAYSLAREMLMSRAIDHLDNASQKPASDAPKCMS